MLFSLMNGTRINPWLAEYGISEEEFKFVGNIIGLVSDIFQMPVERDDPKLFAIGMISSHLERIVQSVNGQVSSTGYGLTLQEALLRAFGEFAERYASRYIDKNRIVWCSYSELRKRNLNPVDLTSLHLFHDSQYHKQSFPFKKLDSEDKIGWVEGVDLRSGESKYLPAQLVYIGYSKIKPPNEPLIGYATSSGNAAGTSIEASLKRAIEEVIERDAFMITWYLKISPHTFDYSRSKNVRQIYEMKFKVLPNVQYHLKDITLDLRVPVFMCIAATQTDKGLSCVIGLSANIDPEKAAVKALVEAAQVRMSLKQSLALSETVPTSTSEIYSLRENTFFYAKPCNFEHLRFLLSSSDVSSIRNFDYFGKSDPMNESALLKSLIKRLPSDLSLIAIDITPSDVGECGFHVCKVFIPQCVHFSNPRYPFLGSERLSMMATRMGTETFNMLPHPLG